MAKVKGRPGPASLFRGKVIARRSAVLTSLGNVKVDALRQRLGKELGRKKALSIGDVFEGLAHLYGDALHGHALQQMADEINRKTEHDTAA